MTSRPVLVQKFGGTSVATAERRQQVVEHVRRARDGGHDVAIVVSAMGRRGDPYATDTLLDLLRGDGGAVDPRDYTLVFVTGEMIAAAVMAQALKRAGIPAVGLTGAQARLYTDGHPIEADIVEIDVRRVRAHLERGDVPVITGGQGVCRDTLDFTTLGRGASDTSGVAFGVALGADQVEIFTDVDGVAIVDPRIVPEARWLSRVSYACMHEMARFGAKVIHPRAVAAGRDGRTPIVVRSTFTTNARTYIGDVEDELPIVGLTTLTPMATAVLAAGAVSTATRAVWERQLVIMSLVDAESGAVVAGVQADRARDLERALHESGVAADGWLSPQAWVSIVGDPLALDVGLSRGRDCLAREDVAVAHHERSERRVTFVVSASDAERAVRALYRDIAVALGPAA